MSMQIKLDVQKMGHTVEARGYLALKTGSASAVGCVLRVYLSSKPSEDKPGTLKSL